MTRNKDLEGDCRILGLIKSAVPVPLEKPIARREIWGYHGGDC
jgi:hypothetical protein